MKLRALLPSDHSEAVLAHQELEADDFTFLLDFDEKVVWSQYLEFLENLRQGEKLPEAYVPSAFLIAEENAQLIGRTSIRYELNDFLFTRGGHIGYAVRPAFRNQGFAKEILKQSLQHIKEVGVDKVLVTCNDDNVYSARTIEACGGVLENKVEYEGKITRRYWIHQ